MRLNFGINQSVSLVLIVFGARLWAFNYAGSPLPFFDQWLAEYNNLFLSLAGGQSPIQAILRHHNEHALITTKLFSLIGFSLNGYWDVKFLVVLAAAARGAVAVLAFRCLAPQDNLLKRALLWFWAVLIFAIPWSGFNTLCGQQISFYFAELALLWSLATTVEWKGRWSAVGLIAAMALGLTSMASALAIPAATLAAHWAYPQSRKGFGLAWGSTALLAGWYIFQATGVNSGAASNLTFASCAFFLHLIAWPIQNAAMGHLLLFIALITVFFLRRLEHTETKRTAIAVGFMLFAMLNSAMIALNRQPSELHPRHWDTLLWMPFGAIALAILIVPQLPRFRRVAIVASLGLAALFGGAFAQRYFTVTQPYYDASHQQRDAIVLQYRDWFLSGEIKQAAEGVNQQLEQKDYRFYDDPVGRYMPHPIAVANILDAPIPSLSLLSPEILPTREPGLIARLTALIIGQGKLLCLVGGILGFISVIINYRKRKGKAHPPLA